MPVDIKSHLTNQNYPSDVQRRRIAWFFGRILFRLIPIPFHGLRSTLLRLFGAQIGSNVRIHPSVHVMFPWNLTCADNIIVGEHTRLYSLAPIVIEHDVLISQFVHLCAGSHDHRKPNLPINHRPIKIESGVWVAADAYVGPGVTVAYGAIIGARSVVTKDIPANTIVAGNPARKIGDVGTKPF